MAKLDRGMAVTHTGMFYSSPTCTILQPTEKVFVKDDKVTMKNGMVWSVKVGKTYVTS